MLLLLSIFSNFKELSFLFTDVMYTREGFDGIECWILRSCS